MEKEKKNFIDGISPDNYKMICTLSEYEIDIIKHVEDVRTNINTVIDKLSLRGRIHDSSKLKSDELDIMEKTFPRLRSTTYGSQEYKDLLKEIKPALDLHYARNDHHPEHFENGVNDMDLFQIVEMVCDWKAAVEKHDDGDVCRSLEINKERFGLSDQLYNIIKNTLDRW